MKKLICVKDIEELVKAHATVCTISDQTIITPAAQDLAKLHQITFTKETCPAPICVGATENLSKDDLLKLLKQLLDSPSETVQPPFKAKRNAKGITAIAGDSVRMDFFDTGTPNSDVYFQELVSKEDSKMSAGFLEINQSAFEWNLTYEEIDYVIEGTLEVTYNGETFTANAGDVLFVPKDTKVIWSSPNKAKVFYTTYPANWADLL